MRAFQEEPGRTAEEAVSFFLSFRTSAHREQTRSFMEWLQGTFPDEPRVRLEVAARAVEDRSWEEAVAQLEGLDRGRLGHGTARHACHLLGMAHFALGDVEKSVSVWEEGLGYDEGDCELGPYLDYAELAKASSPLEGIFRAPDPDMLEKIRTYEEADARLAAEDWEGAVRFLEDNGVFESGNLQLLARLAWAFLQLDCPRGGERWMVKIVSLAHYRARYEDAVLTINPVLPPHLETWPPRRLKETADRVRQWLEDQVDPDGRGPHP